MAVRVDERPGGPGGGQAALAVVKVDLVAVKAALAVVKVDLVAVGGPAVVRVVRVVVREIDKLELSDVLR